MNVDFSPEARADLVEIGLWIAGDNPGRAETFVEELERACAGLAEQPSRFPVAATVRGSAIRKRVHRDYLILYRTQAATVEIVRVVHGKRDWVAIIEEMR
jgi:toxin ParE1/3/4